MSSETAELLRKALALPTGERAERANTLLASLDEAADPSSAAAWESEILRRMANVDSGKVVPLTLEEARRRLASSLE